MTKKTFILIAAFAVAILASTEKRAQAFSWEECATNMAQGFVDAGSSLPALFAPIANAAVFKATVETAEYWTKRVCDESIEEIMSDGAIKAAWAACVKNHASTYEQEKLGWNGGWFPPTSEDIFPYNQRAGDGSKRIRAREADDVIRRATGVSGMKFVGKSDAPSKVMNADQIENMLKRCGVANQREHIEYIQAYAAEKMDYEDWEIEWQ